MGQTTGVLIIEPEPERPPRATSLGLAGPALDAVRRLSALAVEAGAQALVCSPMEAAAVRAEVGPDVTLITPGVRPHGTATQDQARVATPEEALSAGADLLVIGRPITAVPDGEPRAAPYRVFRTRTDGLSARACPRPATGDLRPAKWRHPAESSRPGH
jgi:orotidine-5'-phosphate decarboxylase